MKQMIETLSENELRPTLNTLPTIEDTALLDAVTGGAETVHLYLKPNDPPVASFAETVHLY